ncbi:MAG TPA: helix-turn-helix domain-containing protein [Thermoanaerobaculia bacterium]|jgi:DNA-binding HxlR family transcriptional regulator|nr:helix-turn-helix domain-containing protein [Thermoanaerobaculia bacterium]
MASTVPYSRPEPRSSCPISNALDLLGDRWTLLVIRDLLFVGKRRFGEFLTSPEGIPTNILTDRLRRLEESGVVTKVPYQLRPARYEYQLTAKGKDLFPVLRALMEWARDHVPGVALPPPEVLERFKASLRTLDTPPSDSEEPAPPLIARRPPPAAE